MNSFIISARIGVSNKQAVEKRVENAVESSVHYPISHPRLMDISWLWVGNIERFVVRMAISFETKFPMDCQNVIGEMQFKLFYIFTLVLPSDKLFPGLEEIFERNDIIVCRSKFFLFYIFSMSTLNTPPRLCLSCKGSRLSINCGTARLHIFQNFIVIHLEGR